MLVLNCTLGSFYFGYENSILNTLADKLSAHFQWKENDKDTYISIATSLVPVSAVIGALIGAPLAKFGRKTAMIIVDLISIIGLIVCLISV